MSCTFPFILNIYCDCDCEQWYVWEIKLSFQFEKQNSWTRIKLTINEEKLLPIDQVQLRERRKITVKMWRICILIHGLILATFGDAEIGSVSWRFYSNLFYCVSIRLVMSCLVNVNVQLLKTRTHTEITSLDRFINIRNLLLQYCIFSFRL